MTDDDLLTPKPIAANDALRADLLGRTTRRLRVAARLRLLARVGGCLACFAAGLAVSSPTLDVEVEMVLVTLRKSPPPVAPPQPPAPPRLLSPAELELEAEQTTVKAEAARRFREAGDRYLRDHADHRAALRCYRNFLDEADPADRAVSPEDTWLLASLKRAREQENTQ